MASGASGGGAFQQKPREHDRSGRPALSQGPWPGQQALHRGTRADGEPNGLAALGKVTRATGTAERDAALHLLDRYRNGRRIFQTKGHGEFAFGCVQATMACDYATQTVFFTWDGCDEMDPVHGDGSAEITDDGFLEGEIAFHNGDESGFKAIG
jgi:hypothetical protein